MSLNARSRLAEWSKAECTALSPVRRVVSSNLTSTSSTSSGGNDVVGSPARNPGDVTAVWLTTMRSGLTFAARIQYVFECEETV